MINSMENPREHSHSMPKQRRVQVDVNRVDPGTIEQDKGGLPPKVPSVTRVNNSSEAKQRAQLNQIMQNNSST